MQKITYKSNNGFTGKIYGKNCMSIFDEDKKEVFHTKSRMINSLDELKDLVDKYPALMGYPDIKIP